MQIEFDPAKDAANLTKHGVSLAEAGQLDWENALIWTDTRQHLGAAPSPRFASAFAPGRRSTCTSIPMDNPG